MILFRNFAIADWRIGWSELSVPVSFALYHQLAVSLISYSYMGVLRTYMKRELHASRTVI